MASKANMSDTLMDWVRPCEADGPLVGALFTTYGLSLDQPDFFGQDFLPTLLGLGGVRDRGYASPVTLDRTLATADVMLICDAHALTAGVRPTLRVDVLPIGHKVHHAKVVLIHRHSRVRLIVGSANLTHEGFRRQREVATVLDFHEGGGVSPTVLTQALSRWEEALGATADDKVRRLFAETARRVRQWPAAAPRVDNVDLQVLFGGGTAPLWRQLVDAWPRGEPVLNWHVCSPFWPQVDQSAARNPFEAISNALIEKGCSLGDCDLEIVTRADTPNPTALPRFPFSLIGYLRKQGFPVQRGRILPARLDAAEEEIPQGMAAENRSLHAKWVVLAGPKSVVAFVGSANFTRQGMGVLRDPTNANIEAGVLVKWPRGRWHPKDWRPPIQGQTIDWTSCGVADLREPPAEEEKTPDWADFIHKIELSIRWERLPEPDGELHIHLRPGGYIPAFSIAPPSETGVPAALTSISDGPVSSMRVLASPGQVRAILARRVVEVKWDEAACRCWFPVNVLHESKAGMPSVLGAKPSEEQLLAYFHGRISEEDLLSRLEQQAREQATPRTLADPDDVERLRRLQSYVVREFVESLYGLTQTIQDASYSPRAAEQALLGDLSPVCLGEQVLQAFMAGKRSPAAAGFQLAELIRIVGEITWPAAPSTSESRRAFEDVRRRAIDRLFAFVAQAATKEEFASVIRDREFTAFVRAMMTCDLASRWAGVLPQATSDEGATTSGVLA